jgi:hypothetical protein
VNPCSGFCTVDVPTTAPAAFWNVQDQWVPVLLVSWAASGPACVAVTAGVGGVAGAPPGIASAAAMPTEAAQASRRRRTRAPDRLAIAAMPIDISSTASVPPGLQRTHAPGIRAAGR